MYIVEVLPITRSAIKDSLSYFSAQKFSYGSLVSVPIRNKKTKAIVTSVKEVLEDKAEIKELPYSLKKLDPQEEQFFFRKEFIEAIEKTARYHASTMGQTISAITPQRILENCEEIQNLQTDESTKNFEKELYKEPYLIQSPDDDRFADYKSLIRESFAHKRSVFFCVPTLEDARQALEKLEKGIEDYTLILDGSVTKKESIFIWNKALTGDHPLLIIGTGMFLSIPRNDIGTIIIEKESSRAYKTIARPFVDIRVFAENYSKLIGARLLFGDSMLRTETIKRFYGHELIEYTPLKWRSLTTAEISLIDMREYQKKDTAKSFRIFSDEALELLKENKEDNGHCFIYSSRRGLSPQVVCNDCGTTVLCGRCSSPVVLHGGGNANTNFFLCHKCGEKRSAKEKCKTCDGWNLVTLGIGIETVEKELLKNFPDLAIFRLDHDSVKNNKKAKEVVREFYKTPGAVLLGTEMALLYLDEPLDYSMVASIDSLFAIPDFRGNEKIMNILLKIRYIAQKKCLVQTRSKEETIFDYALKGNIADFYRSEITERETFGYPPFTTLIKITYQGKREEVLEEMKKLKAFLLPFTVHVFPAFIETVRGKYVMHALIKADRSKWPEEDLVKKLVALPNYFVVKIDPDNLL